MSHEREAKIITPPFAAISYAYACSLLVGAYAVTFSPGIDYNRRHADAD